MGQGATLADIVRQQIKQHPLDAITIDFCAVHRVVRYHCGAEVLVWLGFTEEDLCQLSGVWWLELSPVRRDEALEKLGYLCLAGSTQRATMQWPLSRVGDGPDVVMQNDCNGSCMDR